MGAAGDFLPHHPGIEGRGLELNGVGREIRETKKIGKTSEERKGPLFGKRTIWDWEGCERGQTWFVTGMEGGNTKVGPVWSY